MNYRHFYTKYKRKYLNHGINKNMIEGRLGARAAVA